jgi:transposase
VIGYVCDVSRFLNRDHFAAYNGTAPIEVSSGNHKIFRLSRRGQPPAQPRCPHGRGHPGPFPPQRRPGLLRPKVKEGKAHKEALRCLKRRISDAIFVHLAADAKRKAAAVKAGPGGANGERLCRQRGRFTPRAPALRRGHSRARPHHRAEAHAVASEGLGTGREKISKSLLTTKRPRYVVLP